MELDKDLASIQEVRDIVKKAAEAQKEFAKFNQEKVDSICAAIAKACEPHFERLAKMAVEETGFGIWQDKVLKNKLGSTITWDYIKNMKTVGILSKDQNLKVMEVGVPMGVVAALIPSTNPTSTVMYKTLVCLKGGNGIVISPHPNAKNCIIETYKIVSQAAKAAGAPDGLIQCITLPTIDGTNALLKNPNIGMILATGGEAMVKAAYSSGNPALGVGPGNGPAFIERTADIPTAVRRIFDSKTFDNGTICASEQSIVTESCIEDKVVEEVKRNGGYFLSESESKQLAGFIMRANGTMNPAIVGRSAQVIADKAGITIPAGTRILVSRQTTVGKDNPYSREKLCPILAFYVEPDWQSACERCMAILNNEGRGHTMIIHSQDEKVIEEFALRKPVSRLLVNAAGSLGGTGASTGLAPAFTLGCGAVGGSATSNNITPMDLINIRRVAYGLRELDEIRGNGPVADGSSNFSGGSTTFSRGCTDYPCMDEHKAPYTFAGFTSGNVGRYYGNKEEVKASDLSKGDIEAITRAVISKLH